MLPSAFPMSQHGKCCNNLKVSLLSSETAERERYRRRMEEHNCLKSVPLVSERLRYVPECEKLAADRLCRRHGCWRSDRV